MMMPCRQPTARTNKLNIGHNDAYSGNPGLVAWRISVKDLRCNRQRDSRNCSSIHFLVVVFIFVIIVLVIVSSRERICAMRIPQPKSASVPNIS